MDYNYITLGFDCSPAAALRNLGIREFALPFDWVESNISSLEICFREKFERYHKNLTLKSDRKRLIDEYGFKFPHDYPTIKGKNLNTIDNKVENLGEGIYGEAHDIHIVENWRDYFDTVKEKYTRRIERFNNIMNNPNPIIVLCRYSTQDVLILDTLIKKYYNKQNIYIINSNRNSFKNKNIMNIYTEKNGVWNDSSIWKEAIDKIRNENKHNLV